MSSDIAIKVENLSKCYQIYDRPQDRLKQMVMRGRKQYYRDFWALKDVSFEIKKGETVGIIGRNGSGKSTLLQMICGTLNPTFGRIEVNGRVAALLELGSGFNPEFSGRENVYLSATLYGLSTKEIDACFNDIAKFADIGEHIEQPVKTYSSGMYVRLAFAVIAHVKADILVVDEALAVGDAVFTQKCMRFIREFQKNGSLLFVSHDIGSIQNLCSSAMWLGHGKINKIGLCSEVTDAYLRYTMQEIYGESFGLEVTNEKSESTPTEIKATNPNLVDYGAHFKFIDNLNSANGWKSGGAEITSLKLENISNKLSDIFEGGETLSLKIRAKALKPVSSPILGFLVRDKLGQDLFGENTLCVPAKELPSIHSGGEFEGTFVFTLPMLPNGQYVMMASVADGTQYENIQHHYMHDAYVITVSSSKIRWGLLGLPFHKIEIQSISV
jgi:lipopolysaccharide transport system ATP-binding protein